MMTTLKLTPYVRWFDLWVGLYVDVHKRRLYLQPLPCLGVRLDVGAAVRDD